MKFHILFFKEKNILKVSIFNYLKEKEKIIFLMTPILHTLLNNPVLHCSSVYKNNILYIFAGRSGSGKSTISNFFLKKEYMLYSDDFLPFKSNCEPIFSGYFKKENEKYIFITDKFKRKKIKKIIFFKLRKGKNNKISKLSTTDGFKLIMKQNYNKYYINKKNDWKILFNKITDISKNVGFYKFINNKSTESLKFIEKEINEKFS
ncbi:MAG: hypothetical protein ACQESP_08805 [Candidatus Muiribacteriota bacterium]